MLQLFTFVRADLTSYRPPVERSFGYEDNAGSSSNISEPDFPKSLFLIHPLFSTYELNTVAPSAQASVPVPEGLNLDAWIVPPPKDAMVHVVESDEDGTTVETKKVKKVKKGKGKETGGTVKAKMKKKKDGDGAREVLEPAEEMTEAERSELERVCVSSNCCPVTLHLTVRVHWNLRRSLRCIPISVEGRAVGEAQG